MALNYATEGYWSLPPRRDWFKFCLINNAVGVPIVEQSSGKLVLIIAHRRTPPYNLATARAVVQSHNAAVRAARKTHGIKPPQD